MLYKAKRLLLARIERCAFPFTNAVSFVYMNSITIHNSFDILIYFRSSSSSEVPQKVSPRGGRQLKPATLDTASSLYQANKTSKEKSPKVTERRSPRSPAPEVTLFFSFFRFVWIYLLKNVFILIIWCLCLNCIDFKKMVFIFFKEINPVYFLNNHY